MSIGLESVMPFGKHRGKKVIDIHQSGDVRYLCWLRDVRANPPDDTVSKTDRAFFDFDVLQLIDAEILATKSLQSKHKIWNLVGTTAEPIVERIAKSMDALVRPQNTRAAIAEVTYGDGWGSF